MRNLLLWLTIIAAASCPVLADQIVLKNGDRFTGTIVKSDGKELVLKTEFRRRHYDSVSGDSGDQVRPATAS